MKIALIEPFYTGSHAAWADGYKQHSNHEIKIYSMKGRFWKWRMHGGAVHLADEFLNDRFEPQLILATDMLDLCTFLALTRKKSANIKTGLYFHENQLSYPWSPNDPDIKNKRDMHYAFINYTSALAADRCFFNSRYNMESFLASLYSMLERFPDYNGLDNHHIIKQKCSVLNLGLELSRFDRYNQYKKEGRAKILWSHRWEYDKNPDDFFRALKILIDKGLDFEVVLLGNSFKYVPKCFENAKNLLGDRLIAYKAPEKFSDYAMWLYKSDILPVTSNQEFFGISVMEAIYCGCWPIVPKRLTYPELIGIDENKDNFYDDFDELVNRLEYAVKNVHALRKTSLMNIAARFDWKQMASLYDERFCEYI